ncbi:39123_t:CDS:2 [Gigaspora margarita]|uniref:39123_t:CDS:1 n=1 Tax=Gigaspora margarita TaxID=4874 RepID=A0ABM8W768_GIGMA|nr:39123_t:CDS:2 [Gigaspora margarita]
MNIGPESQISSLESLYDEDCPINKIDVQNSQIILSYPSLLPDIRLNVTTVPEVRKIYAIHSYSVEDEGASTAATIQEMMTGLASSAVNPPAIDHGVYLGYNSYEIIVCSAQYQDKWEDFQIVKHNKGFLMEMCKDDHLAYVNIFNDGSLKMQADFKVNIDEKWVLSIDGERIRGLIPILILQQLEADLSKRLEKDVRIADLFDMNSGNSTGSIISLGLTVSDGSNPPRPMYPASELVTLYKEKGRIYLPNNEEAPAVKILNSAYFRTHTDAEDEKFTDKSLKDTVNVDVLVPSYNITEKKDVYFINYFDITNFYKIRNVIRASTAAPTYFEAKQIDKISYVDRGIFMNNPAYKAYLEVKNKFKEQQIVIYELNYLAKQGWFRWMNPLISLMINVPSKLVEGYLENLQDEIRYYRLQTNLQKDIPLDDTSDQTLNDLEGLANNIINGKEFKDMVEDIVNHLKED